PRISLFLVCSFAIGPGLIVNGILKPTWARPRPVFVQQFGKQETFEPWWKPGGDCRSNCSFVSGDATEAFWLLAPASITPPIIRPVAEIAVVGFATALGSLRVVFGRHFPTDVIFAGVIMVIVVAACRRVFLRMDDSKIERSLERIGDSLRHHFARWLNWLRAASQRKSRGGRGDPHQSDEKKRKEHASRGEVLGNTYGIEFFGLDMIAQAIDRGVQELDRKYQQQGCDQRKPCPRVGGEEEARGEGVASDRHLLLDRGLGSEAFLEAADGFQEGGLDPNKPAPPRHGRWLLPKADFGVI